MPRRPAVDAPSGDADAVSVLKLPNEKVTEKRSLFSWQRLDVLYPLHLKVSWFFMFKL